MLNIGKIIVKMNKIEIFVLKRGFTKIIKEIN